MVADAVQKMVPRAHWQSISPSLYTTFWTLKLGDIHSADARYKSAVKSLEDDARSLQPSRGSHSEANVKRSEADKLKVPFPSEKLSGLAFALDIVWCMGTLDCGLG